jgi:hypothetical protein
MNTEVFPGLWKAFGDPGKEFHHAERVQESVDQAGWGAWLVLFGRSWPNALIAARDLMLPAVGQICIRTQNGRLEMRLQQDSR